MAIPGFTAEAAIAPAKGTGAGGATPPRGPAPDAPPPGSTEHRQGRPYRVSLPGSVSSEVGLGDVVKRVTSAVGIRPCGGCLRRAQALNSWLVFSRRSRT
jgi:hypothetical protein